MYKLVIIGFPSSIWIYILENDTIIKEYDIKTSNYDFFKSSLLKYEIKDKLIDKIIHDHIDFNAIKDIYKVYNYEKYEDLLLSKDTETILMGLTLMMTDV